MADNEEKPTTQPRASAAASNDDSASPSGGGKKKKPEKRRSSIFARARQSFVTSNGQRGASVETLRGKEGANFEGKAIIKRGRHPLCACLGTSKREVLVLIKGPFLFVYDNETSQAPLYAVSLAHNQATVKEERFGMTLVLLGDDLGDVDYELTFHTAQHPELAKEFAAVVAQQAAAGETEEIQKKLGHEKLLKKRKSIQYAENVAMRKVKDQPDPPVTSDEVLVNIAAVGGNPYIAPY